MLAPSRIVTLSIVIAGNYFLSFMDSPLLRILDHPLLLQSKMRHTTTSNIIGSSSCRVPSQGSPPLCPIPLTATLRLSHRTTSLSRMQDISHTCMDRVPITRDVSYRSRCLPTGRGLLCPEKNDRQTRLAVDGTSKFAANEISRGTNQCNRVSVYYRGFYFHMPYIVTIQSI